MTKNGEIMAISYSTETVLLDPGGVQDFVESQEQKIQDAAEEAAEKGAPYTAPEVLDQAYIARGLSRILDVEEETILKHLEDTSNRYWVAKKKVDSDVADEVRRFINGEIDEEGNQLTTVDANGNTVLISTGGSAVYSDGAMQYLKSTGIVVYLHHQLDVLAQRVGNLVTRGVVCHSGCNTLEDLYEERCPLYEKYADLMVDFTGCTVEQCHEKLLKTVKAYLSEHPDC